MLVGESSLAAALPYITENTIILIDANVHSCIYMQHYLYCLRTAPTIRDWHQQMADRLGTDANGHKVGPHQEEFIVLMLKRQLRQWQDAGLEHGLDDEATYQRSSQLARQKAIIPWQANIQDPADMRRLADSLRANQATITMANLTNVLDHLDPKLGGMALGDLPMTEHVPILASSMVAVSRDIAERIKNLQAERKQQDPDDQPDHEEEPLGPTYLAGATGPFFGLSNFAEQGGLQVVRGNERFFYAAYRRRYLELGRSAEQQENTA